jgi:hypothetical protein
MIQGVRTDLVTRSWGWEPGHVIAHQTTGILRVRVTTLRRPPDREVDTMGWTSFPTPVLNYPNIR